MRKGNFTGIPSSHQIIKSYGPQPQTGKWNVTEKRLGNIEITEKLYQGSRWMFTEYIMPLAARYGRN